MVESWTQHSMLVWGLHLRLRQFEDDERETFSCIYEEWSNFLRMVSIFSSYSHFFRCFLHLDLFFSYDFHYKSLWLVLFVVDSTAIKLESRTHLWLVDYSFNCTSFFKIPFRGLRRYKKTSKGSIFSCLTSIPVRVVRELFLSRAIQFTIFTASQLSLFFVSMVLRLAQFTLLWYAANINVPQKHYFSSSNWAAFFANIFLIIRMFIIVLHSDSLFHFALFLFGFSQSQIRSRLPFLDYYSTLKILVISCSWPPKYLISPNITKYLYVFLLAPTGRIILGKVPVFRVARFMNNIGEKPYVRSCNLGGTTYITCSC